MSYLVWGLIMAKGCTSITFHRFYKGNNFYYSMFASLDKETPPKEVFSKKEEGLSHRIATSILYDLNLRLEVK